MKHKIVIEIITESVQEEQSMINEFPEAWWVPTQKRGHTTFYLPENRKQEVIDFITELENRK
jgi:hypothetical protein